MLSPSERVPLIEQEPQVGPYRQQLEDAMPDLFLRQDPELNCGNCSNFDPDGGRCTFRNLLVTTEQPKCDSYIPEPSDDDDDDI
jgi:hypothetical protein